MLELRAPRERSRARRSASSCCSRSPRRTASRGAKAFDVSQLRSRLRLRLRPRDADRRDRRRLADLLPVRRPTSAAAPPRRHPAGGRAQRDPRRGPRDRRDAASAASTSETTANVGLDRRRRRRHERRAGALPVHRPRRARSTPTGSRPSSRRWSTAATTPPRSAECDVDLDSRAAFRRLPPAAASSPVVAARGGAAGLRLRAEARSSPAAGRTPTRWRPTDSRASTSPTAPSATTSRASASRSLRSRGCSMSAGAARRRAERPAWAPLRAHLASRVRGQIFTVCTGRPPRGRKRGEREWVAARRRGRDRRYDGEYVCLVASPRGGRRADLLELPAGTSTSREEPLETASASWPRRSQACPHLGELHPLLRLAGLHRRGGPPLPGAGLATSSAGSGRTSGSARSCRRAELAGRSRRRRQDADRAAKLPAGS